MIEQLYKILTDLMAAQEGKPNAVTRSKRDDQIKALRKAIVMLEKNERNKGIQEKLL